METRIFNFMALPPELRFRIYYHYSNSGRTRSDPRSSKICSISKQIREEYQAEILRIVTKKYQDVEMLQTDHHELIIRRPTSFDELTNPSIKIVLACKPFDSHATCHLDTRIRQFLDAQPCFVKYVSIALEWSDSLVKASAMAFPTGAEASHLITVGTHHALQKVCDGINKYINDLPPPPPPPQPAQNAAIDFSAIPFLDTATTVTEARISWPAQCGEWQGWIRYVKSLLEREDCTPNVAVRSLAEKGLEKMEWMKKRCIFADRGQSGVRVMWGEEANYYNQME